MTRARELLSHALPSGDLAALFERAIDELLKHETRRRMGAGTGRGRRGRHATATGEADATVASGEEPVAATRSALEEGSESGKVARSASEEASESGEVARSASEAASEPGEWPSEVACVVAKSEAKGESRYVPVAVVRAVWERDGGQCTFTDGRGRRCAERRFLTLEHRVPHALGGEATAENLCLLCKSHNVRAGRLLFGERRRRGAKGRRDVTGVGSREQ